MTFQTEIEAALAKPFDKDAYKLSGELCEQFGAEAVSYALTLRIRDLESQVEKGKKIAAEMRTAATSARYADWEGCDTGSAIATELENFADKLNEITK